jgi:type I restriction enzyme S subunit
MVEWKVKKLGDVINLKRGYDLPNSKRTIGEYPIISSSGITDYHNEYMKKPPGVITGRYGTIGKVFYTEQPYWPLNTTLYVTDFFGNDSKFIYYFLQSFDFEKFNDKSTVPGINRNHLHTEIVNIPTLPEQNAIAYILSSLDDKLDLLRRQNATLEKMAETLFRQWFVEEAKEEWEEVRLGSIVQVINGVSYKSDDLNPSTTAMVTLKSFDRNGGFRMDGFKEYTGKFKEQHILKEGDLVVAHTDITQEAEVIGNPVMVIGNPKYETLVFSMDLVKVVSKNENYTNEFLYLLMKSREFKEHCLGYSNGSTVLHLSKKAIPDYDMKLPPDSLINEFSKKVKPLVQKQFRNQTQIRTLTAIRDTLLPKLISGEVRVEV